MSQLNRITRWIVPALLVALVPLAAVAQAPGQEMTPEQKAMMQAWIKSATPGDHHAFLAKLAGNWKTSVTFWMAAGAPGDKSSGTATLTPMMNNRYLHEEVHGETGGEEFHGAGLSGFDNVTGRHFTVWVDSMGTGLMTAWGTCDAGHKTITSKGEMADAMTGKMEPFRSVTRYVSDDQFVHEMYNKGKDGKEFKSLEVVYDRVK